MNANQETIPIPPKATGPKPGGVYDQIRALEVGGSCAFDDAYRTPQMLQSRLCGIIGNVIKRTNDGRKYTTRQVFEDGLFKVRCWRVQ